MSMTKRTTETDTAKVTAADIKSDAKGAKALQSIAREIEARVAKLDFLGGKAVDHRDSINKLLEDARQLCADDKAFDAFKRKYCLALGKSRTYELLAIEQGKKTIKQIRADTKRRVAKHRAKENNVTETRPLQGTREGPKVVTAVAVNVAKGEAVLEDGTVIGIADEAYVDAEASAGARRALYAAEETTPESQPAVQSNAPNPPEHVAPWDVAPQPEEPRKITVQLPRPAPETPGDLFAELMLLVGAVLEQYGNINSALVRTELVRRLATTDALASTPDADVGAEEPAPHEPPAPKRRRGRPPGSKNRTKAAPPETPSVAA